MTIAVKVYSTPGCVQCNQTKKRLASHQIEFTEIDMTSDATAKEHAINLGSGPDGENGYKSAPIVEIIDRDDGRVIDHWSGFRYDKIKRLVEIMLQACS